MAVAGVSFAKPLESIPRDANLSPGDRIEPAPENHLTKPHRTAIGQDPMTMPRDSNAVRTPGESIRGDRIDVQ